MEYIRLLYIDLFCGAGGTSTGVEKAHYKGKKCAKVIACVNHDANAIASHAANHPEALHFTEDIRTLELSPLIKHILEERKKYPNAKVVLWASLECTNFSKAKGGQPRDADSRTLAEHLFRYIDAINPDLIQIENVEEFMCWGDLDENGKPISKDKGRLYLQWVENVKNYGYKFDFRLLNAADYGAYTSRKRFFGIFAKQGIPIIFPQPTHSKIGGKDLFDDLKKWKPVKEVLDFSDEGVSIFTRKKPLSPKTLERIYAGLIKFVAGGKDAFMIKYNSVNKKTGKHVPPSIDESCPTVACQNRLGVAKINFLTKYYSGNPENKNQSIDAPAGTIRTKDCFSLIQSEFLSAYYGNGNNHSINEPSPTITCKDRLAKVTPFFMNYYSGGGQHSEIDSPCPGLTTIPKQRLVACRFIDQQFGQSKPASINQPLGAITQNPKYNLVNCEHWLMNTNFSNIGSSIMEPSQTITANRKWHYLMNPQFFNAGSSVDNPCFTLIARMDKMPPYLVATEEGFITIEVYETDSEPMIKIKEFMALYGIADIKMRMLKIPELKRIMGFPENYKLIGTQADQKKFIGNAVEVNIARVLCEALVEELNVALKKVA
ncbi:MAG: DNA cytosine methyltransferase [Bacteroidales bacterium]|jgi:DNA (cytosine-5)-methyltransferase 1|nr:DNA cytosine methyltransferase [Bacteroidales bacterium]